MLYAILVLLVLAAAYKATASIGDEYGAGAGVLHPLAVPDRRRTLSPHKAHRVDLLKAPPRRDNGSSARKANSALVQS